MRSVMTTIEGRTGFDALIETQERAEPFAVVIVPTAVEIRYVTWDFVIGWSHQTRNHFRKLVVLQMSRSVPQLPILTA
jgi:hypothetical protein